MLFVAKYTTEGRKCVLKSMNIVEFARLIIALIVLNSVCHISVRLIAMSCDEPMALYAAISTVTYVTSTVHIQCV